MSRSKPTPAPAPAQPSTAAILDALTAKVGATIGLLPEPLRADLIRGMAPLIDALRKRIP